MAIDCLDGGIVGDRDMMGRDADHLAMVLVRLMDGVETAATPGLQKQPEVGKAGQTGRGDVAQSPRLEIRHQIVGGDNRQKEVGSEKVGEHGDEAAGKSAHQHISALEDQWGWVLT